MAKEPKYTKDIYTGAVIFQDVDAYAKRKKVIEENKLEMMAKKDELAKNKHTYSVFMSPSGNGLKVLVKIPADIDNHKNSFLIFALMIFSPRGL